MKIDIHGTHNYESETKIKFKCQITCAHLLLAQLHRKRTRMTEKRKGKEEIKKRQSRAWSVVIKPIASFAALIGKQINVATEKLA